jgi:hypothetical protein
MTLPRRQPEDWKSGPVARALFDSVRLLDLLQQELRGLGDFSLDRAFIEDRFALPGLPWKCDMKAPRRLGALLSSLKLVLNIFLKLSE